MAAAVRSRVVSQAKKLQCDFATELEVFCAVDHTQGTFAKLCEDAVV
jgi:hypothetical protein